MADFVEKSNAYFAVKLLTQDFLITGYLGTRYSGGFSLITWKSLSSMVVQNARVLILKPVAPSQPAYFDAPLMLVYRSELVAVVPADDATCQQAIKDNAFFSLPVAGEIFSGPFHIKGTVQAVNEALSLFRERPDFPVRDAEITCLLPDVVFPPLHAPFVLLVGDNKKLLVLNP